MDLISFIKAVLIEDAPFGDITTELLGINGLCRARVVSNSKGILSGITPVRDLFTSLAPEMRVRVFKTSRETVKRGDLIMTIVGPAPPILLGERTALNLLQHLSGIATLTNQYVRAVKGTRAKICDTRKTTPLLRRLEKEAVRHGGGVNHRFSLSESVLIKENHLTLLRDPQKEIRKLRDKVGPATRIEVEVDGKVAESKAQELIKMLVEAKVDALLLDNMSPAAIAKAVAIVRNTSGKQEGGSRPILEASGGITLENIREIAKTGVDYISVGALTHSAPALDFTLLVEKRGQVGRTGRGAK